MKPPYESWACLWDGRSVVSINVRDLGYFEESDGAKLKFAISLPTLRRNFELGRRSFRPDECAKIGSFERCLPIMLEAWRIQKGSPQLARAGGRVEIELRDSDDV